MLLDCWKNIREAFEHLDTELFETKNKKIKYYKKKKKKNESRRTNQR